VVVARDHHPLLALLVVHRAADRAGHAEPDELRELRHAAERRDGPVDTGVDLRRDVAAQLPVGHARLRRGLARECLDQPRAEVREQRAVTLRRERADVEVDDLGSRRADLATGEAVRQEVLAERLVGVGHRHRARIVGHAGLHGCLDRDGVVLRPRAQRRAAVGEVRRVRHREVDELRLVRLALLGGGRGQPRRHRAGDAVVLERRAQPRLAVVRARVGEQVVERRVLVAGERDDVPPAEDDPDGGGSRYLSESDKPFDLNSPFNQFTTSDIGSSTKLIVATAVVRELAKRHMQFTSKVADYFPSCWKLAANMDTLTFKDLMNHNAGLARISDDETAKLMKKDSTGYLYQRTVAERGRTGPKSYYNQHYVQLGWVLAGLLDKPKVEALFAKHGCGKGTSAMVKTMQIFEAHVLDMLRDQGVRASWKRSKQDSQAKGYNFADQSIPGALSEENINPSGGLKMTARELGEFMAKLDAGAFVDRATVWQMKIERLGGVPFSIGDHGWAFTKDGFAPVRKGRGYGSRVTLMPGGVQIIGVWNSSNNGVKKDVPTAMVHAWEAGIK
jgi:Beta-lactamase